MRRNCNLTLRLLPPHSDDHHLFQKEPTDEVDLLGENRNQNRNQNQQLTIFYDGRVSVCDVTDVQARTILKLASEEIEGSRTPCSTSSSSNPSSPLMVSSMKRSLQRFLQKRKHRIQATSPYHR